MEVKQLDQTLVERANSNSFYNRGTNCEQSYKAYINEVISWEIPDSKKQKILDKLHEKYSKILSYEAQHVPVMVAGPAKYNAKKLDKSDQIMKYTKEFCDWFDDLKRQIEKAKKEDNQEEKAKEIIADIKRYIELGFDPRKELMCLANVDNKKFIELYEKLQPKYKWRKNSNIFKLYTASLNGEVKEIKNEVFFEDENLTAYIREDRAYIKFILRIKPQLKYALKSRKWWWNSYEEAWSTYLNRVDKEWVSNISKDYSKYL